jgi:Holliday junction resolvase RusA-like endonuclease
MLITIKSIPPSLNKFAGRKNEWEYWELKKEWKDLVYYSALSQRPPKPIEKSIVTITYFFKTKIRRDPDNYTGKLIMDGLTACGIIKDDSFECVELRFRGAHDKENPRTEIEIERVIT